MSAYEVKPAAGLDPLIAQLVRARKDQNLSQGELALKAGVSRGALCRWEIGRYRPALTSLTRWARALGLTLKAVGEDR